MLKLIQRVSLVFFILAVIVVTVSYVNYRALQINNNCYPDFKLKLIDTIKENDQFNMSRITKFDWDTMYIFSPYTSKEEMERTIGTAWTTAESYIGYIVDRYFLGIYPLEDDSLESLVFVKAGKVICDCTFYRSMGDFTKIEAIIKKHEADFIVERNYENIPVIKQNL